MKSIDAGPVWPEWFGLDDVADWLRDAGLEVRQGDKADQHGYPVVAHIPGKTRWWIGVYIASGEGVRAKGPVLALNGPLGFAREGQNDDLPLWALAALRAASAAQQGTDERAVLRALAEALAAG